jgi:hypothetical protein
MQDIMQEFDSTKPKSFIGFLTRFLPKHNLFACTIVTQGQTYLSITADLVGYVQRHITFFTTLGIQLRGTKKEHHCPLDCWREQGQQRELSLRYKQKRKTKD